MKLLLQAAIGVLQECRVKVQKREDSISADRVQTFILFERIWVS